MTQLHREPSRELYPFGEAGGTFVFVEQWVGAEALTDAQHGTGDVGEHLDGTPDMKMLQPVVAGGPATCRLRG